MSKGFNGYPYSLNGGAKELQIEFPNHMVYTFFVHADTLPRVPCKLLPAADRWEPKVRIASIVVR